MIAIKSIRQDFKPSQEIISMMETFREMVNHCIRLGLESNTTSLEKFSSMFYHELDQYQIMSYYKYNAMSQACGRLSQMKRCIKKGMKVKSPFVRKPYLTTSYGFKINGILLAIPTGVREKHLILLNDYTVSKLSEDGIVPRSFTITPRSISISVRKEVKQIPTQNVIGIDRNLRNVTISTCNGPIMYRTDKMHTIASNTERILASFRRYDVRAKRPYQRRLKSRAARRRKQYLQKVSKDIVERAKETNSVIVFEDLTGIGRLYRKGNGQGKKHRQKMNWWPRYMFMTMVTYKAAWEGIPVIFVDPKRTSKICPVCGERIQVDRENKRKLLCLNCNKSMDRDVLASMNIACKGWSRFCHPRGLPVEAMTRNLANTQPVILRVDGSKLQVLN